VPEIVTGGNVELEDQQGDGDGEDAVAERLESVRRPFYA